MKAARHHAGRLLLEVNKGREALIVPAVKKNPLRLIQYRRQLHSPKAGGCAEHRCGITE